MRWYLRACPVCRGDMHEDVEARGWVKCLMCGRSFRSRPGLLPTQRATRMERPSVEQETLWPRRWFLAEQRGAA